MPHSSKYIAYINSSTWKSKSRKCQKLTKNHCILLPWLASRHCHHLTYSNLENEIAVSDVVPLSVLAHKFVHLHLFWKTPMRVIINGILRVLMVFWILVWLIAK